MTGLFERSQNCICELTPSLDFFLFVHWGGPGRLCHQGESENRKDCPKNKKKGALEPLPVPRALEIIALGTFLGARQALAGLCLKFSKRLKERSLPLRSSRTCPKPLSESMPSGSSISFTYDSAPPGCSNLQNISCLAEGFDTKFKGGFYHHGQFTQVLIWADQPQYIFSVWLWIPYL